MRNWFSSLNGAIILSLIALITELWRAFVDSIGVYPVETYFVKSVGGMFLVTLIYTVLFAGWMWALLRALRGSRGALVSALIINVLFLIAIPLGTLAVYCPSPCPTLWPIVEVANWVNLLTGLLAAAALVVQLRRRKPAVPDFT